MNRVENHRLFYNVPASPFKHSISPEDVEIYSRYNRRLEDQTLNLTNDNGVVKSLVKWTYGNLNKYSIDNDKIKEFNKAFRQKIHSLYLSIINATKISMLPSDLLVLEIDDVAEAYDLDVSVIPKGIVSMKFGNNFPFNGKSLRSLKNLKILVCNNFDVNSMPKFPKSIEYISFENSNLGHKQSPGLNDFKLSDYPNLKYLNVKYSGFTKKSVPQDWIDSKKNKVLQIFY